MGKQMKKMKISYLIILIIFIIHIDYREIQSASAAMKNGSMITLTEANQVIDSITYNGITVDAVYTYASYANNDTVYCCAAFIKKFYSMIYGISVYNLNSTSSTPFVYNSKGSFAITASPQVGDIIRDNNRTHWAIVKEISGSTISVIQQSYKTGNQAFVNCTIDMNDLGYSYFTYSNRIDDTQISDSSSNQSLEEANPTMNLPITTPTDTNIVVNNPTSTPNITPSELSIQESSFPMVTLRNKTLYTGYKKYTLKFTGVTKDAVYSFHSSDTNVAKINASGKITPVSGGVAFITVIIIQDEITYKYNVTVTVKKPYIKLINTTKQISNGEAFQFSADIIGMDGTITWSTSDDNIATIDSKTGELFGRKKGFITVSASSNGIIKTIKNVKID
jgi:hypothetical protein